MQKRYLPVYGLSFYYFTCVFWRAVLGFVAVPDLEDAILAVLGDDPPDRNRALPDSPKRVDEYAATS